MELIDRLKTLPQAAQLKVMERVFQKLLLAFGNQMQAKWQGIEMQEVYLDWAEVLAECSLGAINHAINLSRIEEHPPSQGAFLALCKTYKPALIEHRLNKPKTSSEEGLRRIAEVRDVLAGRMKITEEIKHQE